MGLIKELLMEIAQKAYPDDGDKQSEFFDLFTAGVIHLDNVDKGGLVVNGKRFVWDKKKKKVCMVTCKRKKQVKIKD
jgi:hypothetical protein